MSMAPTQLLKAEHDRVFREVVVPNSGINDVESVDASQRPKAIILAGQPGAGKGGLTRSALAEFGRNAVIVDTDECRDAHPRINELRKEHPYTWSGDTHPDASAWAGELMSKAVAERKNIIYDTTLANGEWATTMIKDLMQKGYDVEVRVMATSSIESELGVDQRFTGSVDQNGFGRFVPEVVRSHIYGELPKSLDAVAGAVPEVPISIYNRESEKVFDSREDQTSPGQALIAERNRRFTDGEILQATHEGWLQQKQWHERLAESCRENPKIDVETATNLISERHSEKVVECVDRMTDASGRFLQQARPGGGGAGDGTNEQQAHGGQDMAGDNPRLSAKL